MPNNFFTPVQAARSSLAALRWVTTLPRTVHRDAETDFVPGLGAVVNVRNPIDAGEARTYSQADRDAKREIVLDNLSETTVPVKLDTHLYKAVGLSDEDLTLNISDFERQVLRPQTESVAKSLPNPLIANMVAIAGDPGTVMSADGANALKVITRARRILNSRQVPLDQRWLALGVGLAEAVCNLPQITEADKSGTDGALREGIVGRLRGFTLVEDPHLPEDVGVAYHRDAFAFVSRPPANPSGATRSETVAADGFSVRWIQDYDPRFLMDRSVVSAFVGATTLDAKRAIKITTASTTP
ncbi:phage capsid protein [Allokutzneria sp. A3M-2-11 16]|uniref:P22 phage major capsid protein family protein n=1 Tax=Allokutzneria sp. A3M-2-11 16 TaxID=2962043 RepID=UPI0020B69DBE|nr:P22 phage major capsid protein family protein [Allokutzneria sp. A3M-2-11 16]MCP3801849.1 phage capsid protein [Allokutzneria sp. A3M-2-11 16]